MPAARNRVEWPRLYRPARYVVLLGLLYAYVLGVLGPQLLFHDQSPAFFLRWASFSECVMHWPGGLAEYAAAGLSQTYAYPWLGALVITVAVGAVCLLGERVLSAVALACAGRSASSAPAGPQVRLLGFVPGMCLVALLGRYTLPLSVIVSFCAALLFACAYAMLARRRVAVRVISGVVMCGVLYVATGGVSVLFACLCALLEVFGRRSVLTGLIVLVAGAGVPYVGGAYVYQIGLSQAFGRLTSFEYDFWPPLASIALYVSLPLSLVIAFLRPARLVRRFGGVEGRRREARREQVVSGASESITGAGDPEGGVSVEGPAGWSLRTAMLVLAAALVAYGSFDADRRTVLAIDYHARHRQWDKVLEAARPLQWWGTVPGRQRDDNLARTCLAFHFPVDAQTSVPLMPSYNAAVHDVHLALAHSGALLDDLFRYPQPMGASVVRLLPDSMGAYVAHSYNADVLFDLGDVNEAERVACESLANVGPRPWLLDRLALINVLKGRPATARACLAVMACDPRHRVRAEACRRELEADPSLAGRADVQLVRSRMYQKDRVGRLMNMHADEEMLRYLLVANPHNRMAFDYLMAHYLVTLRDDEVAGRVRHLKEFGYTRMPRHCEEAVLMHARLSRRAPDLAGFRIRPETMERFEAFQRDLDALGGPGGASHAKVRDALVGRYGDTYWFYALFGNSFFGRDGTATTTQPGEES